MELIAELLRAWGWAGITPEQIVGDNDFGNLIIKDVAGRYWRLCPDVPYCKIVAHDRAELGALSKSQEFLQDWYMSGLVEKAKEMLGPLRPGYKYCLKIPSVLGGEYGGANLASIPLRELVAVSGYIAKEIEGLPDGTQVRLRIAE
jgi:hypothetical protein